MDRFTELGRPRNTLELDLEYHRLLSRDRGPFSFLYSGMYFFFFFRFQTLLTHIQASDADGGPMNQPISLPK